jgi:hypothetical protein
LPSSPITLAYGPINGADTITTKLIQPADHPPIVRITWPARATIIPPARFTAAAAEAARLFAAASTKLSEIKAQR